VKFLEHRSREWCEARSSAPFSMFFCSAPISYNNRGPYDSSDSREIVPHKLVRHAEFFRGRTNRAAVFDGFQNLGAALP
jgi:hypothetical protein